jgi:hypothetical protein
MKFFLWFFISVIIATSSSLIAISEDNVLKNTGSSYDDKRGNIDILGEGNMTENLSHPWQDQIFTMQLEFIKVFEEKFGCFSHHPLVGRVSCDKEDVKIVSQLMKTISSCDISIKHKLLMSAEVITKVIAYRDLVLGQELYIATPSVSRPNNITKYTVDKIFDLWKGMPAFGLIPDDTNESAILLFRGTDGSLKTKESWCSIICDLDFEAPGYKLFQNSQTTLHQWLNQMKQMNLQTRVMGYSLGGILATYTVLRDYDLLSQNYCNGSIAFNPPGVTKKMLDQWQKIDDNKKPSFSSLIVKNDVVSMSGHFFGNAYVLTPSVNVNPVSAHVDLITAKQCFYLKLYDEMDEDFVSKNVRKFIDTTKTITSDKKHR